MWKFGFGVSKLVVGSGEQDMAKLNQLPTKEIEIGTCAEKKIPLSF